MIIIIRVLRINCNCVLFQEQHIGSDYISVKVIIVERVKHCAVCKENTKLQTGCAGFDDTSMNIRYRGIRGITENQKIEISEILI